MYTKTYSVLLILCHVHITYLNTLLGIKRCYNYANIIKGFTHNIKPFLSAPFIKINTFILIVFNART